MRLLLVIVLASAAGAQTVEWTLELAGAPLAPTLYPDAAKPAGVVVSAGPEVVLADAVGKAVWRVAFERDVATPPAVADLDGDGNAEVVVGLDDGAFHALAADGAKLWEYKIEARPSGGFDVIVAADVHPSVGLEVLFGYTDGWLHCLSARGTPLWRFYGDPRRVGPAAVGDVDGDGAPEVLYSTDNGHVYCLNGFGQLKWRFWEHAPYGRSGINVADLKGDGSVEVLLTRSNNGPATCLMALDGPTGKVEWRSPTNQQSYISNAVVDLDGDGVKEVLHTDKGNWLYCTNFDGTERWRVELAGRGSYFAPAVADFNGDGALEIVVPIRDTDPVTKACMFHVDAEGKILAPLTFGTSGNAAPAAADIDGDGKVELLAATAGPNKLQAISWEGPGAATVAWPSLRGSSSMTASTGVAAGTPLAEPVPVSVAVQPADVLMLGENALPAAWDEPPTQDVFAISSVHSEDGFVEHRVTELAAGSADAEVPFNITRPGTAQVRVLIVAQDGKRLGEVALSGPVEPAGSYDLGALTEAVNAAAAKAASAGADALGLQQRLLSIQAQKTALQESTAAPEAIAAAATALRKAAGQAEAFAAALDTLWTAGDTGSFVYWQDENPWDKLEVREVPDTLVAQTPVAVQALGDEYEDVALNLLNVTDHSITVRAAFNEPNVKGARANAAPELAKHALLRKAVMVPSEKSGMLPDALPPLDDIGTITLAPGEVAQLWVVFNTHALESGTHELPLYIGSLEEKMTLRVVPLTIEVSPVRLPVGVYAQMNWAGIGSAETSDQQLEDMLSHGVTVAYGPPLPKLTLDAEGKLTGEVDWSILDQDLKRVPEYFQLLWHGPPSVEWPEGVKPEKDSDLFEKGFALALQTMVAHLAEQGWPYERWGLYPYDEPWLTGDTLVGPLREFCQRVKKIDPKVRNYTDPAGNVRAEYLEEFKDLIDIWQPEMNLLKRDPELLEWFHKNAKTLWAYEATDPGKDLLPLGYYRGYAWLAWHFKLSGAGFWVYKDFDNWWPLEGPHWGVTYPVEGGTVASRRWEATRDGQEDYRLFYLVRERAAAARARGDVAAAEAGESLLQEAIANVVGWQVSSIDEITRQTRKYEIDYTLLLEYRRRLVETAQALVGETVAPNS